MKAVGYYQSLPIDHPDALLDLELPEPTPGPRDLLVEVRAISVNPVDTKVRQRAQPEAGQAKVLAGTRRAWCARSAARSACSVLAIGSGTPGTSPAPVATASCIGSTSALPGTCRKASTSPRPRPCR